MLTVKRMKMISLNSDMSSISVRVSLVSGEQGMQPQTVSCASESGLSSSEGHLERPSPSALVCRDSLLADLKGKQTLVFGSQSHFKGPSIVVVVVAHRNRQMPAMNVNEIQLWNIDLA